MRKKNTLKQKAFDLWRKAGLPDFFNRKGPKRTPAWLVYACHMEYTNHAPAWRRAADFMTNYHDMNRHWTAWQKALAKWPAWVWEALATDSIGDEPCEVAAIDGTSMARSNPSQHYLHRINHDGKVSRSIQQVIMVDVYRRKFLSWRVRARPRGEKCDVPYIIKRSPVLPEGVIMDKGFDSEPLHTYLRDQGYGA